MTNYEAKINGFVECVLELMSAPGHIGVDEAIETARNLAVGTMDSAHLVAAEAATRKAITWLARS